MTFLELVHRSRNLCVLIFTAILLFVIGLGWWAAGRIDEDSLQRQVRSINRGLSEIEKRVPFEQDTSAVWNEAVINLRENNQEWIADNLAEWISSYFDHNRVYLLDPWNSPVRVVIHGELASNGLYDIDRPILEPMIRRLRAEMATVSEGRDDSTDAIAGMGIVERAVLKSGEVGIVSIRPIVPDDSSELPQAPGEEFLHISIKLISDAVSAAISEQYGIRDLRFTQEVEGSPDRASAPVLDPAGQILGYFT